ncbi:MAG: hypothetical protein FJ160_01520 [Gammaproteobacteria bacterium]|nr:hypothetical protein [Gammaproteobacteria bacterium]
MVNFDRAPDPSTVTWTHVIYALHALSVLIGVSGAATIVGSFIFGVPSIVAVVMNYARRSEARDTWLESHFSWQIRTFWIAFFVSVLVLLFSAPLMLVLVGFATAAIGLFFVGIWVLYRVLRGWLALREARTLPT